MGLVGTLGVVEAEVITETDPGISAILICFQIHLLIFYCPPQPLDEQVVIIASFPIHADFHSVLLQQPGEGFTGKLGALVGVEYLGFALPERLFQSLDAEAGVQCVGKPPGKHVPAVPVDNGYQVQKSPCHGDVGDVCCPDLVWPCYSHATEQVGVDFMTWRRLTRPGTPVYGLDTHHAHESPDTFPVDAAVLTLQAGGYLACSVEWCGQVLTVNQLHKSEILLGDSFGLVVQAGAADIQ